MAVVKALEDSLFRSYKNPVFLSYRRQGTCQKLADRLCAALLLEGFHVYKDESEIEKAIKESKIWIIVLSKDYASSGRCLDELVMIFKCRRTFGHVILPFFYDVDSSQIWSITEPIEWFQQKFEVETGVEMKKHQRMNKLEEWREALRETVELGRVDLQKQYIHEVKFIQQIIEVNQVINDKTDTSGKDVVWNAKKIYLVNRDISELPENPYCPALVNLFLHLNPDLTEIPLTFFERMPALQVLDLSNTGIESLPPSISRLVELKELYLSGCELMELPPEIGALVNLKVLDLEGTELICLPKEIGRLLNLKCLKLSLYRHADRYIRSKSIVAIIPSGTLSEFSHLSELNIDVDPDCEWWDVKVVEAVISQLFHLRELRKVKMYLPTVELLQQFLQLLNLDRISDFRLIVGRYEKPIIYPLPHNLQNRFEKLPRCLKYVNGEGKDDGIARTLRCARALFLDSHWTIERLPVFKIDEMTMLKYCLLMQCNEMKTVIDGGDFYQDGDPRILPGLDNLKYLSIHFMKNLARIWKGPIVSGCMSNLTTLALHTCPKLTTIFNLELLCNLINLTELIVEDCPEIKSLVCLESYPSKSDDHFLPCLKKMSLLHLPKLVSISSDLRIAPKLERVVIFNCPNLKSLSHMEVSNKDMKEIKGESLWWEELHKSEWGSYRLDFMVGVFVPLGRDADLMDELTEAVQTSLSIQPLYFKSESLIPPKKKHVSTMMGGEFMGDSIADSFNKLKNKSKNNPGHLS